MNNIHPTAIVHPTAKLGDNVYIGPYCVVKDCEIGDNVFISAFAAIGDEAEHSTEKWELNKRKYPGKIVIGNNVVIREFVTVHQPIKDVTYIGNNAYIMGRSHIGHDIYLEDDVVISNCTILGGWTRVMRAANLGISSITHQFTTVGPYAMVAANASVVKDVPPLAKYIPNKPLNVNVYAIRKWKLPLDGDVPFDIIKQDFYVSLTKEWEARRHEERSIYTWTA